MPSIDGYTKFNWCQCVKYMYDVTVDNYKDQNFRWMIVSHSIGKVICELFLISPLSQCLGFWFDLFPKCRR